MAASVKKQQKNMNHKPKLHLNGSLQLQIGLELQVLFKTDCAKKRNYNILMSTLVTLSMKNTFSSTSNFDSFCDQNSDI